jgi:hypothetical protein
MIKKVDRLNWIVDLVVQANTMVGVVSLYVNRVQLVDTTMKKEKHWFRIVKRVKKGGTTINWDKRNAPCVFEVSIKQQREVLSAYFVQQEQTWLLVPVLHITMLFLTA